jgi:ProP effector
MKSMNTITPAESVDTNTTPEAEQAAAASAPVTEAPAAAEPAAETVSASTTAATESTVEAAPEAASSDAAPATAAAPAKSSAGLSPRALLKQLQQEFPAFRDCLPLSIGIDKQLLARMPGLDRKVMRAALGIHTGSMRYLRAMEKAKLRYDLDGTAGAEVPDTHRAHAKEQLQQRFKKEAERKKAERDAAAAEEADRMRQEKLQALASKFSKN